MRIRLFVSHAGMMDDGVRLEDDVGVCPGFGYTARRKYGEALWRWRYVCGSDMWLLTSTDDTIHIK